MAIKGLEYDIEMAIKGLEDTCMIWNSHQRLGGHKYDMEQPSRA